MVSFDIDRTPFTIDAKRRGLSGRNLKMKNLLQESVSAAFRRAKIAQLWFLGFNLLIFLLGLEGALRPELSVFLASPLALLVIFLVPTVLALWADDSKSTAEIRLRYHEYWDAYGIAPPDDVLPKLACTTPGSLTPEKAALFKKGMKFASKEHLGDRRCLENLRQSAWFTAHLAGHCGKSLLILTALIIAGTLFLLVYCLQQPSVTLTIISTQTICAGILLVQGVGLVPTCIAFRKSGAEADRIVREATVQLKEETPNSVAVHRLLSEYQVLRAATPLLPDFVWISQRDKLNPAFEIFRKQETLKPAHANI